eukprot:jgi/Orpsp1_1/1184590/evm.model.c7180000090137.1
MHYQQPIDVALKKGNERIIKYLVEHGAYIKDKLEIALKSRNEKIIKYLIDKGADVNYQETLKTAVEYSTSTMVNYLIEHGAK